MFSLEDHPHSDQVVAADVENDTLTYSVHSEHGTKGNVTIDANTGAFTSRHPTQTSVHNREPKRHGFV